jgi:hypothetical protein
MAEGKHETFGTCIRLAERHTAVMGRALFRFLAEILERVVHPAHVPFVREPEPALDSRSRNLRPCRRLFGDHHGRRELFERSGVHFLQERNRFKIFATTILVRYPLAIRS